MSELMTPISFRHLMNWIVAEHDREGSVFGVHRATLARAIQHLKQEAIIACFTCRRVEIIDMERLRHMAHL